MARAKLTTKTDTKNTQQEVSSIESGEFSEIVKSFIHNKSEADKYSKLAKAENTQIKETLEKNNLTSFDTDEGSVKISVLKSESFREDDLIKFLKDNGLDKNIVVMKEVIDFDALESAIYHKIISDELVAKMDACKDVTTTKRLLISKKKGE